MEPVLRRATLGAMRGILVVALLLVEAGAQQAPEFRPLALYGDHMVLPRHTKVPIRGVGTPGAMVTVTGSWQEMGGAQVGADGRWQAMLQTRHEGGPFEVRLQCNNQEVVLRDVLVGDVWLASGQSNMEMPIGNRGGWQGGVQDWQREVAEANHPQLRVFTVERVASGVPLDDVRGSWQVCSPATAAGFSASAYFFARDLLQQGKGPQGLVVSAWGGTVCEAWTSERGLAAFPEFGAALAATKPGAATEPLAKRREQFWAKVPKGPGPGELREVEMPDLWSKSGLGGFDGVAFYQRFVPIPPAMAGADLWLELGAIDDMDTVWCNGVRVGGMEGDGSWSTPRRYRVPAEAVQPVGGELQLVVRVVDTGGEGGFTGRPEQMRFLLAADEKVQAPVGGRWFRRFGPKLADLPPWPRDDGGEPNRPAVLWNGMVAPLAPFPFTGAIWYQGESNIGRHEQYARLFPAMIQDWRAAFGTALPFYFVQIAPFGYGHDGLLTSQLRLAQAAALALPHTGMVVTLDVGDAADIHPRDKQTVGRRLALLARRDHYGEAVVSDGPLPERIVRDGATLRISFRGTGGGLAAPGGVSGFETAGADGVYAPAAGRLDGETIVLETPANAVVSRVRYGFGNVPTASLRNAAGLPAAPFEGTVE
jgi:sialate O-acetylesterase